MITINVDKRKRSCNFTKEEESLFMEQVEKYKTILDCKATDKVNNFKKNEAWNALTSSFNAVNRVERTTNQLKAKYDNLKRIARRSGSQGEYYVKATAGAPSYKSTTNEDTLMVKYDVKEEQSIIKEEESSICPDNTSEIDYEYKTPDMQPKEEYYKLKTALLDEELKLKKMEVEDRVTKRTREEVEHQMKIEEHNIRLRILKCDLILKKREIGVKKE